MSVTVPVGFVSLRCLVIRRGYVCSNEQLVTCFKCSFLFIMGHCLLLVKQRINNILWSCSMKELARYFITLKKDWWGKQKQTELEIIAKGAYFPPWGQSAGWKKKKNYAMTQCSWQFAKILTSEARLVKPHLAAHRPTKYQQIPPQDSWS